MKVWVVTNDNQFTGVYVEKVFDSLEKAKNYIYSRLSNFDENNKIKFRDDEYFYGFVASAINFDSVVEIFVDVKGKEID